MFRKIRHDENLIANNYLQMPANVANKKSNVFNFISNIINIEHKMDNETLKKNFNAKDEDGNNILHILIINSLNENDLIAKIQLIPNIETLINDVNYKKQTPLHLLCENQYFETYKLIKNKLDGNILDDDDKDIIKIFNESNKNISGFVEIKEDDFKSNKNSSNIKINYKCVDIKGRIPLALLVKGIDINDVNKLKNNPTINKNNIDKIDILNNLKNNDDKYFNIFKNYNNDNCFGRIIDNDYSVKYINKKFFDEYINDLNVSEDEIDILLTTTFLDLNYLNKFIKKNKSINKYEYEIINIDENKYWKNVCEYIYRKLKIDITDKIMENMLLYYIFKKITQTDNYDFLYNGSVGYILNTDLNVKYLNEKKLLNKINDNDKTKLDNYYKDILQLNHYFIINYVKALLCINNKKFYISLNNLLMKNLRYDLMLCIKFLFYYMYYLNNIFTIQQTNIINSLNKYTKYGFINSDFFDGINNGDKIDLFNLSYKSKILLAKCLDILIMNIQSSNQMAIDCFKKKLTYLKYYLLYYINNPDGTFKQLECDGDELIKHNDNIIYNSSNKMIRKYTDASGAPISITNFNPNFDNKISMKKYYLFEKDTSEDTIVIEKKDIDTYLFTKNKYYDKLENFFDNEIYNYQYINEKDINKEADAINPYKFNDDKRLTNAYVISNNKLSLYIHKTKEHFNFDYIDKDIDIAKQLIKNSFVFKFLLFFNNLLVKWENCCHGGYNYYFNLPINNLDIKIYDKFENNKDKIYNLLNNGEIKDDIDGENYMKENFEYNITRTKDEHLYFNDYLDEIDEKSNKIYNTKKTFINNLFIKNIEKIK